MNLPIRAVLATLAVLTLSPSASKATSDEPDNRTAVLAESRFESDADNFDALMLRSGLLPDYRSHLQNGGFAVQDTHYSQGNWSADVPGLLGIYRDQKRETLEGISAEFGVLSVNSRARPVGDITWSQRPRKSTGFELIAAGDVVGTRAAIERSISYGLLAGSVEQQFGQRLTGIALVGWQPFTDGNSRALFRARLILSVWPEQGVSTQVRWRQYTSSEVGTTAYYNPGHYRNWDAGLLFRRRAGTWVLSGLAAAGQERADSNSSQGTGIAELRAEGSLSGGAHLAIGLLYSSAAGFATSPNYWYSAINMSLTFPLGH